MKQFKSLFTLVFRAMQSLSQLVVQLAATPEDNGAGAFSSKHVGVRESVNKSAASAASLDYVKFQADWIVAFFLQILAALPVKK